ncbi:MAG: murein biosynthesis integral membrane protein MurJ [Tissierellaceae bacterium]|nr:murein biosynthesis integral membrane protein MurJ [Tissierellaceae bacterium]
MTKKQQVAQSALMISIFTLISKGLGFLREVMIASKYGSGMETDTYFVAMTATVIIMGTLGSALNTTLIPIFSEIRGKGGRIAQRKYLNNILNIVILITVILAILAFIFSPVLIKILAKGFEGEQFDMAVRLNRIGLPIVIFLGITYVFSGYLQSNQIFGPHAIMGIPYNFVFLIYLLFFSEGMDISILMLVSVIASSTQFLIQYPAVRHSGYRYSLNVNLRDPYLKKAMILVVPVLLGSAVRQINAVIDKTLASELIEGSISALTYSQRINEMVISVFVMAITTVVFPMLSEAFSQGDTSQVKRIFNEGVNIILLITVPATIGIMILAEPIVYIFFERNAFNATATQMTSSALFFYSIGLVGSSLRLMLNKVFYSFQDTKTPMINGTIAVILNVVLNLLFISFMAHDGLALATSISAIFTTILLFMDLRKKMGPIGMKDMLVTFAKTLFASIVMGAVVYLIYFKLGSLIGVNKLLELILLLLSVVIGAIVYFVLCMTLKVKEVSRILRFRR